MKLSVILPARDEELLISSTIQDIIKHLNRKKYSYELLVIVNACTDNTIRIINQLATKYPNIRIIESKPGYGFALRKGLKNAKGDYVAIFNVDFYDHKLIDLIDVDMYGKDLLIGSKRAYWSSDKRPLIRRIISTLLNWYLKLFFGFKGSDTHGIKLFNRKLLDKILPLCKTKSGIFDTELVMISQFEGASIADFPVEVREIRPPRFVKRLLQTPKDLIELHKTLTSYKQKKKSLKNELFYDSISDLWSSKINNLETSKRLNVVFNQLLKGVLTKDKKFLEVGCGLGYFSKKALRKGVLVTGLDIGQNLVEKCQKDMTKGKFVVGSATKLPFKKSSFDIVLCTEVIEHTNNPKKAINELIRVTKKGGYVVITTPNKVYKPFFDLLGILKIRPYHGNENWFYPWELKKYLLKNKVKIVKEVYFNIIYPHKVLDSFEKYPFAKFLAINQGYLIKNV